MDLAGYIIAYNPPRNAPLTIGRESNITVIRDTRGTAITLGWNKIKQQFKFLRAQCQLRIRITMYAQKRHRNSE